MIFVCYYHFFAYHAERFFRTTVQVKTHAQHIVKLMEDGADPFKELEDYYATDAAAVSKKTKNGNTPSELRAAQLLVALKYNM